MPRRKVACEMIKVKLSELSDSTSDQTLENQNEEELQSLHGKIKQLRSVTIDILDDSNRQHDQLDRSTNTFSAFTNSLFSTRNHHSRSMASQSALRQYRLIMYVVGALVVFWLLSKVFRGHGGGAGPGPVPVVEPEYK